MAWLPTIAALVAAVVPALLSALLTTIVPTFFATLLAPFHAGLLVPPRLHTWRRLAFLTAWRRLFLATW